MKNSLRGISVFCDECIPVPVIHHLQNLGADVERAIPGSSDVVVLETSCRLDRILITHDKDFGELAIRRKMKHTGILRLAGMKIADQCAAAEAVLAEHSDALSSGAIITATLDKIRIRRNL